MHLRLSLSHDKVAAQCSRKDLRLVQDIKCESLKVLVRHKSRDILNRVEKGGESGKSDPCLDRPAYSVKQDKMNVEQRRRESCVGNSPSKSLSLISFLVPDK